MGRNRVVPVREVGNCHSSSVAGRLPVLARRYSGRGSAQERVRCMAVRLRRRTIRVVAVVAFLASLPACEYMGGRTVLVEFQSGEGISADQAVYFAGVHVGKTGTPGIVAGQVRVPVHLLRRNRDALPRDAVFASSDDPNESGKRALVGYAVSVLPARIEDGAPIYRGVSCELELAVLVGAAKARELFEEMRR